MEARGCVHQLSLNRTPPARSTTVPVAQFVGRDVAQGVPDAPLANSPAPPTQVISAAYQLWHDQRHPLLRSLPPWFVVRGHSLPQLSAVPLTLGLLDRELGDQTQGTSSATQGLLDALFAFALRMQKAMQLLADTGQTLEQVAQAVGYQDAVGFSKVFKRTTGQSPRQFRDEDARTQSSPLRVNDA